MMSEPIPVKSGTHDAPRLRALDGLRGLAALAVALSHFTSGTYSYFTASRMLEHASLFVDLFFVLSGFVIAYRYTDEISGPKPALIFLVRRFFRLWPLHIATLGFLVALECLHFMNGLPSFGAARETGTLLLNVALLQGMGFAAHTSWNAPSWSISVELYLYIVFAGVCLLPVRIRKVKFACFGLLAFTGVVLISTYAPQRMNSFTDYGFPRGLFDFFTGTLAYAFWRHRQRLIPASSWLQTGLFFCTIGFVTLVAPEDWASLAAPFLLGALILCLTRSGVIVSMLESRPIQKLGLWSYSIYMIHSLVQLMAPHAIFAIAHLRGVPIITMVPAWSLKGSKALTTLYIVFVAAMTVTLSSLTFRLIEQPGKALGKKTIAALRRTGNEAPSAARHRPA